MKLIIWGLRFTILVVLVWFSVKNAGIVTLHAYPWSWEAPLVLIILAFFAGGVVLGLLASVSTIWKLRREVRSLNKTLRAKDNAATTIAATAPPVSVQPQQAGPNGV